MMSRRTIRIVALVLALFAGLTGVLGYNFVEDKNILDPKHNREFMLPL